MVTLIGVAISCIEDLALYENTEPSELLARYLYLCNKRLLEHGEEEYMNRLAGNYPLLEEAIS